MGSTQGTRWEAALATLVAMAVTFGMYWTLARLMRPWAAPVMVATSAIDVVWIARERTPARMAGDGSTAPARSPSRSPLRRAREAKRMNEPETAATDAPAASRAISAVYLMQARRALALQARAEPVDPFADRARPLPGEGRERFRMRTQTSVASVVSGIGRMFGGRDPDEPCRENRRNIGDLALDGDSAALQQQLDYERRLCRP